MSGKMTRLELSRSQILSFRRRVNSLDKRLPAGAKSLRQAAWVGLQDSMRRAALLVSGEIVGVWRRSAAEVSIEAWRRLSSTEREAVEAEAVSLPLPGLNGPITILWS